MLTTQWLSEHRNCYFDIDCVQNALKYLVHVLDTTAVFRKLRRLRQVAQQMYLNPILTFTEPSFLN